MYYFDKCLNNIDKGKTLVYIIDIAYYIDSLSIYLQLLFHIHIKNIQYLGYVKHIRTVRFAQIRIR